MSKNKLNYLAILVSTVLCCPNVLSVEKIVNQPTNQPTNRTSLSEISVIADRTEIPLNKYAGQISILESNDLNKSENVTDTLGDLPGIETGGDFGRNIGLQFKIRGFGSVDDETRVIVKQDGVKRSLGLYANFISSARVDSDLLKRIEVVKGTSSILHGSGAIGGVISMQSKNVDDFINPGNQVGFYIGSRLESNNMKNVRFAFATNPDNYPVDFLAYVKRANLGNMKLAGNGGFDSINKIHMTKVENDEKINTYYLKAGWDINPEMRLTLSSYIFDENLVSPAKPMRFPDLGKSPSYGNLYQKDLVSQFTYKPYNNKLIDLSASLYKSNAFYHRKNYNQDGSVNVDYKNKDSRWGINIKNKSSFDTSTINHKLVVGFDYENREENSVRYVDGIYDKVETQPNFYKDYGIYVQDTLSWNKLQLTLGGRYDSFKRGINLPGKKSLSNHHFSPKFATSYEILKDINLLASYTETFRAPIPDETSSAGSHIFGCCDILPNKSLKAETARDIEFGLSVNKNNLFTKDDHLYFKTTYFTGNIDDMIIVKGMRDEAGNFKRNADGRIYVQYQNVDKARRKGFELATKYNINNLYIGASYDHLKLYDATTKERIAPFADKLVLNMGYLYEPWDLNFDIKLKHQFKAKRDSDKYTTEEWNDTTDEEFTVNYVNKSFTTVDLNANWSPKNTGNKWLDNGFNVQFGINNVFNKKFIHPNNTENTFSVGKGRNFYLDIEKTF